MQGRFDKLIALAAALLVFAAGGTLCLVVGDDGDTQTVTTKKPVLDGVDKLDPDNNLEQGEVDEVDVAPPDLANVGPDFHQDTRDELPPGVTPEERNEAQVTPPNPLPPDEEYERQPVGGAQTVSCPQNFVQNSSPRTFGTVVSQWVLHITVSSPGSLRAIWNLFNTPSFGASSTYLLELDKECEQIVPFGNRPWTQLTFNNVSESVEIVTNLMTKNEWLASPIMRDAFLAQLTVERLKARGLPPRHVNPNGCTPQAGYMDHDDLECGNNHIDVGDTFPWGKFHDQVVQIYKHGTLCDARCRRIERQTNLVKSRREAHAKTHRHYSRHARQGECRKHVHQHKPSDYTKKHCRDLKLKIKTQHQGIRRGERTLQEISAL